MKRIKIWAIITINVALFAVVFAACKDPTGSDKKPPQSAELESLKINGKTVVLGIPSKSLETAEAKVISLLDTVAAEGVSIEPKAFSEKTTVLWGKMEPGNDAPAWGQWETSTFADGDFLVICLIPAKGDTLYYIFVFEIEETSPVSEGLLGKVLILQAYGTGNKTDGGISHSFVELYNKSNAAVDLTGVSLHYSGGGTNWKSLDLSGQTIPAGSSFLVLGKKMNEYNASTGWGRLQLEEADADMRWQDGSGFLEMNNNAFKLFLVENSSVISLRNPFDALGDKTGIKVKGYVDLLGTNDTDMSKNIDAFETNDLLNPNVKAPYYASKGKSIRRITLFDTDDNALDFERIEWRTYQNESISQDDFDALKPRSTKDGPWNPVHIREPIGASNARLGGLLIGGTTASTGAPAATYSAISYPGAASISNLVAGSASISIVIASGASFRTAKVTGTGAPYWDNVMSPSYSFASGDFLYIEVKSADGHNINVYKIVITVVQAADAVTVSGTYALSLNSDIPQQAVAIEAYSSQTAGNKDLISSVNANILVKGSVGNGTWSMKLPSEQNVWFKVMVTDNTGFTFGKTVSDGMSFNSNTSGINLVLGPFEMPKLEEFILIDASALNGIKENKPGSINESNGAITFTARNFTIINANSIIDFHKLAANFKLSKDSKLYAGNVEQISGVTTNNYYNEVAFTVVSCDNVRKTYTVAGPQQVAGLAEVNGIPVPGVRSIVNTTSWQTQGFGIMNINTANTLGFPIMANASGGSWHVTKLNMVWNPTGTFTYISPTGRVVEGKTEIKGRGNYSVRRHDAPNHKIKSFNLKLNTAAGFDYYDYKEKKYITLPEHRRWSLLAHQYDNSRIRTTLGFEMGRRVLTNMGWQPHADWVFTFINGEFYGMFILCEVIKPDEDRLDISPLISSSNLSGGFAVEINNTNWYANDIHNDNGNWPLSNEFIFDEIYNFMSSHQNTVNNSSGNDGGSGTRKQQGVVFSFKEPDSEMGWYYADPPEGNGDLTYADTTHFPRKGIVLHSKLSDGTAYNRASRPVSEWIVPDDFGDPNGMGTKGMLQAGNFGQNNGGVFGSKTLGLMYPDYASSAFVTAAKFLQDAEDAIYSREESGGVPLYTNYIDVGAFIDWQIAMEMASNWEVPSLNGHHMHYDPGIGKLKMGPIWDLDNGWNGNDGNANPGFTGKGPFWLKELMGWEMTGVFPEGNSNSSRRSSYYITLFKERWEAVKGLFNAELDEYIDMTAARFSRITSNYGGGNWPGAGAVNGGRTGFKSTLTNRRNALDPVFKGW
ncbi:MAG: CotH kinase family protein [Treponema sp.]|nr:CotH kinase family protein [Treponema sp.]